MKFRLYCFHKNFITFITEIFKISIRTVVVIIWAEIWCWTWSECGCGRVVYCHECKCWLVPRSDLMDHITSQGGQCASALGVFFWHDCETGTSEDYSTVQAKVEYIHVICVNKATTQGILKTHNEAVHENVQYTCNLCEYKRKQQGHLNTHIESVHEKVRYPCIQCHKQFRTHGYLKIYIESVQLPKWEI